MPTVSVLTMPEGTNVHVTLGLNPAPICDTVWVSLSRDLYFKRNLLLPGRAEERNQLGKNDKLREKVTDTDETEQVLCFLFSLSYV